MELGLQWVVSRVILGLVTPFAALGDPREVERGAQTQLTCPVAVSLRLSNDILEGAEKAENQIVFNKHEEFLKTNYHIHMLLTASSGVPPLRRLFPGD